MSEINYTCILRMSEKDSYRANHLQLPPYFYNNPHFAKQYIVYRDQHNEM